MTRSQATPSLERLDRVHRAHLLLIFTPDLVVGGTGPAKDSPGKLMERLEGALREVDIVQVRIKPLAVSGSPAPHTAARDAALWTERVLDVTRAMGEDAPLVMVNDRLDVAMALAQDGVAGVHLGRDDTPIAEAIHAAPHLIVGASTHGARDIVEAAEAGAHTLGFGPVFPTATKGYGIRAIDPSGGTRPPLGPEAAWVATQATSLPLFPIGGIDLGNASELAPAGRCAVGSAILQAEDPARAARALRVMVSGEVTL